MRLVRTLSVVATVASIAWVTAAHAVAQALPTITHGVASGDVTPESAILWARSDREATMNVRVTGVTGSPQTPPVSARTPTASDFTAQVKIEGLNPNTLYVYEIRFENAGGESSPGTGTFRTAPDPDTSAPVSLIWAGDLAGQGYCRRDGRGYEFFERMADFGPDLFVANGDMIYADSACPADGPIEGWVNVPGDFPSISSPDVDWENMAEVAEVYLGHWRYNRADPAFQRFLSRTPMVVQWDDHEVINDFGAPWPDYAPQGSRAGYPNIVEAGLESLFNFHPIERNSDDPNRLYRSFQWGRDLELFVVDARSYRSPNALDDTPENMKTMLGAEQLAWLTSELAESTATWKVVSTDVPLSAPTGGGFGRDAFANGPGGPAAGTGFERELLDLLAAVDQNDVRNLVFVATDVHYPAQIRYDMDFDGDGDRLLFHELISGPLSAIRLTPPAFDQTLRPTILYAEGNLFNFGTLRIGEGASGAPHLWTDIRDEDGRIRPGSSLELVPAQ